MIDLDLEYPENKYSLDNILVDDCIKALYSEYAYRGQVLRSMTDCLRFAWGLKSVLAPEVKLYYENY